MTLTPQQRLEAYEWAKAIIVSSLENQHICLMLDSWCEKNTGKFNNSALEALEYFPEFLAQKPIGLVDVEGNWFTWDDDGYFQRLAALDRAIELVKEKI